VQPVTRLEEGQRTGNDAGQSYRRSPRDDWELDRIPTREVLSVPVNRPGTERLRAFALVSGCVEPPAGIEPATPSLPSMRGWFTTPHSASRPHTTAQVRGAVEGCVMGQSEVARSAVSGKSLARAPGWSSMGTNADAIVPVALDRKRLATPLHCCRSPCAPAPRRFAGAGCAARCPQRLPPLGAVPTRPVTSSSTEQSRDGVRLASRLGAGGTPYSGRMRGQAPPLTPSAAQAILTRVVPDFPVASSARSHPTPPTSSASSPRSYVGSSISAATQRSPRRSIVMSLGTRTSSPSA